MGNRRRDPTANLEVMKALFGFCTLRHRITLLGTQQITRPDGRVFVFGIFRDDGASYGGRTPRTLFRLFQTLFIGGTVPRPNEEMPRTEIQATTLTATVTSDIESVCGSRRWARRSRSFPIGR